MDHLKVILPCVHTNTVRMLMKFIVDTYVHVHVCLQIKIVYYYLGGGGFLHLSARTSKTRPNDCIEMYEYSTL